MHIGIVHYAAPPVVGGVELTIYHHARLLTELGHRVTVIAGQGDSVQPGVTFWAEPLAGSRGEPISSVNRALADGKIPDNFEALVNQTQQMLRRHLADCQVVIGHNLFTLHKNLVLTSAVHRLVEAGDGPPWVAWHHDFAWLRPQYQNDLHPGDPWELLRRPWPGIQHVTVSQAQQADLAQMYGIPRDTIAVISPGVEPKEFYRCPEKIAKLIDQWGLLNADCIFLLPARITRRKNIELGLQWLAAVRQLSDWDARLIVTGPPGPHNPTNLAYLNSLLSMRKELEVEQAAHFVYEAKGSNDPLLLSNEELANFYQIADGLFFPSRQEGFGIPILEAGLARVPIFCTNLPPFRESASTHATFFAPDTPSRQVAQAIIATLQKDQAFQLRRRVLANFTWQGVVSFKVIPLLQAMAA
jgi:glycosyltransferase involved in cell wall biosynthesis